MPLGVPDRGRQGGWGGKARVAGRAADVELEPPRAGVERVRGGGAPAVATLGHDGPIDPGRSVGAHPGDQSYVGGLEQGGRAHPHERCGIEQESIPEAPLCALDAPAAGTREAVSGRVGSRARPARQCPDATVPPADRCGPRGSWWAAAPPPRSPTENQAARPACPQESAPRSASPPRDALMRRQSPPASLTSLGRAEVRAEFRLQARSRPGDRGDRAFARHRER